MSAAVSHQPNLGGLALCRSCRRPFNLQLSIMPIDWQTLIALLCVFGAGTVIARRAWSFLHPKDGGCGGGCVGCGSANPDKSSGPLISLSLPSKKSGAGS